MPQVPTAVFVVVASLLAASCTDGSPGPTAARRTSPTEATFEPVRVQYFEVLGERRVLLALDHCGSDYRLQVEESAERVDVAVEAPPQDGARNACGALATVILDEPLGDRRVANARTGNAIARIHP